MKLVIHSGMLSATVEDRPVLVIGGTAGIPPGTPGQVVGYDADGDLAALDPSAVNASILAFDADDEAAYDAAVIANAANPLVLVVLYAES